MVDGIQRIEGIEVTKTITGRILDYLKNYPNKIITPNELVKQLGINYATAIGTLYRLSAEGKIKKIERGQYIFKSSEEYMEAEKGEFKPVDIDKDIRRNIRIVKSSDSSPMRNYALMNLEWLSNNEHVGHNPEIIKLINSVLEESDSTTQIFLVEILRNILNFEFSEKGDVIILDTIVHMCYDTMKSIILSENLDMSARIIMWEMFVDVGKVEDAVDILLKIAKDRQKVWGSLGGGHYRLIRRVSESSENIKEYLLKGLYKLLKHDDENIVKRAEEILQNLRTNYYFKFYCSMGREA